MGHKAFGECGDCDHCRILGYDPRKEIMTLSYWCKPKNRHTSPGETCRQWVYGDPWARTKEAFGR